MGGRLPGNRRMALERTFREWQTRWEGESGKASWMKRLIVKIKPWATCEHHTTNYFFTQFLTGHGSYGTFTLEILKTADDLCRIFGTRDSPEQAIQVYRGVSGGKRKEALGLMK